MIETILSILPVVIFLGIYILATTATYKRSQKAKAIKWTKAYEELAHHAESTMGEQALEDAVLEQTVPKPESVQLETAYEEAGMGAHTPQGDEARHATRPKWVDVPSQKTAEGYDHKRLKEAVILSEIIGPPKAKQHRRRYG
ncbi:MAG: hypothetical protein E7328_00355 [Clostridiales bacterium]|nr:hypothetical protein [Clostridiales bacterium]